MIRRFSFVEGTSSKFWQIERHGEQVITTYGRIGTAGTSTTKVELSESAAEKLVQRLVAEKAKKGYVEDTLSTAPRSTTSETPSKATHFALGPDYKYVNKLLTFGEDYVPRAGDTVTDQDTGETGTVIKAKKETFVVRYASGEENEFDAGSYLSIDESPTIRAVWDEAMRNNQPDGVAFGDEVVSQALHDSLAAGFEHLCVTAPIDYHPGSGTRVRDLVHPSLFPYVKGTSRLNANAPAEMQAPKNDRWGRTFEGSAYQWLPSQFQVSSDGKVAIASYINNLPEDCGTLQSDLAQLFEHALPLLESVVGYVAETQFWVEDTPGIDHEGDLPDAKAKVKKIKAVSLRGRDLQVIPKLVEYKLEPGEVHEGVWHVEGMSHEHIVATCVYVLDRDPWLEGGELSFKRGFTVEEAGLCFWGIDQSRPKIVEELVTSAEAPLGTLATPKGRLFVFPNSHIHKLNALRVTGDKPGHRRVIVFWLVDPEVTIVSTRDVPKQQGVMRHEEALAFRLALMEERKRHKTSFNIREVSLCEH
jgi:predicted DNA-binding WGR domain protein